MGTFIPENNLKDCIFSAQSLYFFHCFWAPVLKPAQTSLYTILRIATGSEFSITFANRSLMQRVNIKNPNSFYKHRIILKNYNLVDYTVVSENSGYSWDKITKYFIPVKIPRLPESLAEKLPGKVKAKYEYFCKSKNANLIDYNSSSVFISDNRMISEGRKPDNELISDTDNKMISAADDKLIPDTDINLIHYNNTTITNTHTRKKRTENTSTVCVKNTIFENLKNDQLQSLIKKFSAEKVQEAVQVLNFEYRNRHVYNPLGLLKKSLKNGIVPSIKYSNSIKAKKEQVENKRSEQLKKNIETEEYEKMLGKAREIQLSVNEEKKLNNYIKEKYNFLGPKIIQNKNSVMYKGIYAQEKLKLFKK